MYKWCGRQSHSSPKRGHVLHYANDSEGVVEALKAARPLAIRVPFKDECVDFGSHKHLPDSNRSLTNSPNRNQE